MVNDRVTAEMGHYQTGNDIALMQTQTNQAKNGLSFNKGEKNPGSKNVLVNHNRDSQRTAGRSLERSIVRSIARDVHSTNKRAPAR